MIRVSEEKIVINGVLTPNGIVRWECDACGDVIKCSHKEHTILNQFEANHLSGKCQEANK